jgi:hypothetical protein
VKWEVTWNAYKILFGELEEIERAGREDNIKVVLDRYIATLGGGWI